MLISEIESFKHIFLIKLSETEGCAMIVFHKISVLFWFFVKPKLMCEKNEDSVAKPKTAIHLMATWRWFQKWVGLHWLLC